MVAPRSHRFSRFELLLPLLCSLSLSFPMSGCEDDEDSEIGTPCEEPEDCSADLVCDEHDGKGTCQHPHGHLEPGAGANHRVDAVGR